MPHSKDRADGLCREMLPWVLLTAGQKINIWRGSLIPAHLSLGMELCRRQVSENTRFALGRGGFEATVPPELWPLSRVVTVPSKWAGLGQGVAPRCSPSSEKFPFPNHTWRKEQTDAPGMDFPLFSSKQGKAGDNCRAALSIVTFWKGLQNLWEATGSRIWEELIQGRERSEQGGCSCSPAVVFWI